MEELGSLLAESRELALKRFELLRPYLDGLISLRSVATDQGIPYRTAGRWVAGCRKDGQLSEFTIDVVETARENLVIGQA